MKPFSTGRPGRVKTAQKLPRHANSRITLDFYQQSVTNERRVAQAIAFQCLVGGQDFSTLRHPKSEEEEEVAT